MYNVPLDNSLYVRSISVFPNLFKIDRSGISFKCCTSHLIVFRLPSVVHGGSNESLCLLIKMPCMFLIIKASNYSYQYPLIFFHHSFSSSKYFKKASCFVAKANLFYFLASLSFSMSDFQLDCTKQGEMIYYSPVLAPFCLMQSL